MAAIDFSLLSEWRRYLHTHPEESGFEVQTAAFIVDKLKRFGIPCESGIGGHGVVATLSRPGSHRSVGLRAEMDALPISEENTFEHASRHPGVMHACGHDGHTTALIGAAIALSQDPSWRGTVQFLFQPAEENGRGAKAMLADDLFKRFPMDRVFTFHNWPGLDASVVAVHDGPVMAAGGRWTVTIRGVGGHAATPHLTRDPIVAAGHLIVALQTIVARNVNAMDSVVLSIGQIQGGSASNQIPASVTLSGTLRTYSADVRAMVIKRMEHVIDGIAVAFEVEIEREILSSGRAIINTHEEATTAAEAARKSTLRLQTDLDPSTTGDDFSFLLGERPGAYVWIGNGLAGESGELHTSRYDFNDAILPSAVQWLSQVALLSLHQ